MTARKPARAVPLVVLLAGYLAGATWLTWPLALDAFGTLPCTSPACTFDTRYSAWVLAWESHALVTPAAHVGDANIYHPAKGALYYGPAGFGALPYFAPAFLATGSAAFATNLLILLSAALSALSLHWVVRRWTGLDSAGFVAAATLLLHPWYLWGFVAATPHLAPLQYFPLIVWLAAARDVSFARGALLAALIVLQCLTDPVYVAAAVAAPVLLLVAWRVARAGSRRDGLLLAGALGAALLCLVPFLLGYLRVRAANPLLARQSLWKDGWQPADLTALFWKFPAPTTLAPAVMLLVVGGVALALRRRARRDGALGHDAGWAHATLWLVVGVWISLTPVVRWAPFKIYLPQHLLDLTTPLYEIIRAPDRLGVAAFVGAGILAGIAFAEIVRALERRAASPRARSIVRVALAAAVVCALYWAPAGQTTIARAYPVQRLPVPPPTLAAEIARGSGPLIALPALRPRSTVPSSRWNATAMYLSTFHFRPLLNGYSSYWPAGFVERMVVAEELPAPKAIRHLVQTTGVTSIWVDMNEYGRRDRDRWRAARLGQVPGLVLRAREDRQLLFTIDPQVFGAQADTAPR